MKTALRCAVACAVVSVVFASPALAAEQSAKSSSAACSRDAKGLKGEEREKFIALCLKAHDATATRASSPALEGQQNKMKKCNEEAGRKALHGDERRAFMSTCLKA